MDGSSHKDDEEFVFSGDFGDFLDRLDKFQSCDHEAHAKDQFQRFKMELRFLRTFSKCIATREIFKSSFEAVASSNFMSLFSSSPSSEDETCQISSALQVFVGMRSKIMYFYPRISWTSPSYVTNELALELINDLIQNLADLQILSAQPNWVVHDNIINQISVLELKRRLQLVKNFLHLVEAMPHCCQHQDFKKLVAHSKRMAIKAACVSYSCFANQSTKENTFESHQKPWELTKTYIGVLEYSKSSETSLNFPTYNDFSVSPFLNFLHELLLVILKSNPRLEISALDQLKVLDFKFRFIRTLSIDQPRENYGRLLISNDLSRSVDSFTIELGSLIFSLYTNEMTGDHTTQMNSVIFDLLKKMKYIKFKAKEIYFNDSKTPRSKVPKTDGLGFIQFLLENLEELLSHGKKLLSHEVNSVAFLMHCIKTIQQEFELLIPLLKKMEGQIKQHEKFTSLWIRVIDVAYHVEYIIDSFVIKDGRPPWHYMICLDDVVDELLLVKADVVGINSQVPCDTGVHNNDETNHSSGAMFSMENSPTTITNVQLVGFEDEVEKITDLLIHGCGEQLDIISIFGMPGLGKTTLSKRLYNSTKIEKHFHVRAWCCISQVYRKKDLLLTLLGHIIDLKDEHKEMEAEVLASYLRQRLMGETYLVVMDDIWDIKAWLDLQESFPNTNHGSRIIFTTRILDIALKAKLHSDPYFLRSLNDEESWILLQESLFSKEGCPMEYNDTGKLIATNCKGLPLSVVVIAGLLRTDMTLGFWKQVANTITTRIISDKQARTLDIIDMSYRHLPNHLKPCFLYLGAFLEDQEIPAKNLIQLWCAEGFVRRIEGKRIEETARNFLQDLINRSLLTISEHSANGWIKACRIHDLLFHFCKIKAKEENFWQLIDGYDHLFPSDILDYNVSSNFYCSSTSTYEQYRLCIYSKRNQFVMSRPSGSHVRSLLLIAAKDGCPRCPYDVSFICYCFELLRVLDLECLNIGDFPRRLDLLVHLRYLALSFETTFVPSSIANLWNLQTLILKGGTIVVMPESIWNMKKLRHLHVGELVTFNMDDTRKLGVEQVQSQSLENLQTISIVSLTKGREEETLKKIPNIRKLSCKISNDKYGSCHFPALELLNDLESVNVSFVGSLLPPLWEITFPTGLKKLTFSGFNLDWSEISIIGRMENLEVLKLRCWAFEGPLWDMEVGEFPKLKHLELYRMDLEEWNASCDNFSCLKNVRLLSCDNLKKIPSCLGELGTLEMIEVKWCPELDVESIRKIEAEQVENGNPYFKAFI